MSRARHVVFLFASLSFIGSGLAVADSPPRPQILPGSTVTDVSPNSVHVDGGDTITITGTGFTMASTATVGGTNCPVTFVNSTELTCTTPAGVQGWATVSVSTPLPVGAPDDGAAEPAAALVQVWYGVNPVYVVGDGGDCESPSYWGLTPAVAEAAGASTIHACAGTYREPELVLTQPNLTIEGAGADLTVLEGEATTGDASTRHRIIDGSSTSLVLSHMTLRNGTSAEWGGAVRSGEIEIRDSHLSGNTAVGGGAVYAAGRVWIYDSVFTGNGGIDTITGGAIWANGYDVQVTASTFAGNGAGVPVAGTGPIGASVGDPSSSGGAIVGEQVAMLQSSFTGNEAVLAGGAIIASTAYSIGSTFDDNRAVGSGDLSYGGAIRAFNAAILVTTFDGNDADVGGAVDLIGQPLDVGTPAVSDPSYFVFSTFANNGHADEVAWTGTFGGAIASHNGGPAVVVDTSTMVGNRAYRGGAVWTTDGATVDLGFSTLVDNVASWDGGVVWSTETVQVSNSIISFDAATPWYGCATPNDNDTSGIVDLGGNFTTSDRCPGTVVGEDDLDLGELTDNGGYTETILPGPTSVVIDAAVVTPTIAPKAVTVCGSALVGSLDGIPSVDQRGVVRTTGECDSGAVEAYGQAELSGSGTWRAPFGITEVQVLLVGGGGGGGEGAAAGGGGGGDVLLCDVATAYDDEFTYEVGTGGGVGLDGGDSSFGECTTAGGGSAGASAESGIGGQGGTGGGGTIGGDGATAAGGGGGGAFGAGDSAEVAVAGSGGSGVTPLNGLPYSLFGDDGTEVGRGGDGGLDVGPEVADDAPGRGGDGGSAGTGGTIVVRWDLEPTAATFVSVMLDLDDIVVGETTEVSARVAVALPDGIGKQSLVGRYPSGEVTFYYCTDTSAPCTVETGTQISDPVATEQSGSSPVSDALRPDWAPAEGAGQYYVLAVYSGDDHFGSASSSGESLLTVGPAPQSGVVDVPDTVNTATFPLVATIDSVCAEGATVTFTVTPGLTQPSGPFTAVVTNGVATTAPITFQSGVTYGVSVDVPGTDDCEPATLTASFAVAAEELPATGGDPRLPAWWGATALGLGIALMLATIRRRRSVVRA